MKRKLAMSAMKPLSTPIRAASGALLPARIDFKTAPEALNGYSDSENRQSSGECRLNALANDFKDAMVDFETN